MDPALVGDAGNFDAAVGREVVDQRPAAVARVRDVPVEGERLPRRAREHDPRAVLLALSHVDAVAVLERGAHLVPFEYLALAARDVLVERDVEPVEQIGPPALD